MPEPIVLDDLLAKGRLKRHQPSAAETRDLLAVADRHLRDASLSELSDDGRFTAAYGAVLALATIVIGASGYRVGRVPGHHRLTIDLLPVLVGAHERAAPDASTPAGASATRPTTSAPELPPPRRSRL